MTDADQSYQKRLPAAPATPGQEFVFRIPAEDLACGGAIIAPMPEVKRRRLGIGRRWIPALLLLVTFLLLYGLLNVSRPGPRVEGCLEGCATALPDPDDQLRILSLNMLHGYPDFEGLESRLALIAGEIKRRSADLILLQEVPWNRELGSAAAYLAREAGMNHAYLRANGNHRLIGFEEGELILSRYPLAKAGLAVLRPRASFFENRVVLWATAQTPDGDLNLFVTHLTNGKAEENAGQARDLAVVIAAQGDGPAIMAGDFNAEEGSPQIKALSQAWVDSYRALYPERPGYTCCIDDLSAGREEKLEKRIDYVFVRPSGRLQVLAAEPIFDRPFQTAGTRQWASDHTGLLVTLRFSD